MNHTILSDHRHLVSTTTNTNNNNNNNNNNNWMVAI